MEKQPESDLKSTVKQFVAFMVKKLGVTKPFKIKLASNRTSDFKTNAYYDPTTGDICVYIKNRQTADILRSIAHEMVHHKQNQDGKLNTKENIPDIGGQIEDEANSVAGQLVKEFGYTFDKNIYV